MWYGTYGECTNHEKTLNIAKGEYRLALPELIVLIRRDIIRLKWIGIGVALIAWSLVQ